MLQIERLKKVFPGSEGRPATVAVEEVSFAVNEGDFFTLLGPSGCGKTTTLQCIAGLEVPDSGTIRMGNSTVYSSSERIMVPANRRRLGMVFQSYAIWPHMSVFQNVAFPLLHGADRRPQREVRQAVGEALEMVELAHLAERPAPMLSGGQQQRVALARALVHKPRILLLDEPLSNLDAKLRETMRNEIRALVKSVGITTVFVTHDQVEAVGMSDQIVLMRHGRIIQQGTPREIYHRPNSVFTADFMGRSNLVRGRLTAVGEAARIDTPLGTVAGIAREGMRVGDPAVAVIRPQAITLYEPFESAIGENRFPATIASLNFLGDVIETMVVSGGERVLLMLGPYSRLNQGEEVIMHVPPEHCVIVPADPESPAE